MKQTVVVGVSVVIPVYNEADILEVQVRAIIRELKRDLKEPFEIIIVNNGSTDETPRICRKLNRHKSVRIVTEPTANYGLALRRGISEARGRMIVNYDVDFYDVGFLHQALALEPFGYDIIVASKNIKLSRDQRKTVRRLISSFYKYILYYGFGLQISDTHGIKVWRNDARLKKLIKKTIYDNEIFDTELIIRSQYAGRRLLELPTRVVEIRRPVSSIVRRAARGAKQITKLWIRLKFLEKKK